MVDDTLNILKCGIDSGLATRSFNMVKVNARSYTLVKVMLSVLIMQLMHGNLKNLKKKLNQFLT